MSSITQFMMLTPVAIGGGGNPLLYRPLEDAAARVMTTTTMSRSGLLDIPEGQIFWKYDAVAPASSEVGPRPVLLFIHAGVADHTLWDDQVSYFTSKGWNTLRYDLFGYGKSVPSSEFLASSPRPAFKHFEHPARLVEEVLHRSVGADTKAILIGLSRGAATAVDSSLAYPDYVSGLVVVAGGLSGFEYANDPREDALFEQEAPLTEKRDIDGLIELTIKLWGDGPLQPPGRAPEAVRRKLRGWGEDIAARECDKVGGSGLEDADLDPPAAGRLAELKIPVAVGLGIFDETGTNAAMRHLHSQIDESELEEFMTAHMVNLELPGEFKTWLERWLDQNFVRFH